MYQFIAWYNQMWVQSVTTPYSWYINMSTLILRFLTCCEQPSVHPQEDLYIQFYGIFFMHPYQQSSWCQDLSDHPDINQTAYTDVWKNTIKLHVQVFLRMNTWLFGTGRRQYNWIKSLMKKVCNLLVLNTYVCTYTC